MLVTSLAVGGCILGGDTDVEPADSDVSDAGGDVRPDGAVDAADTVDDSGMDDVGDTASPDTFDSGDGDSGPSQAAETDDTDTGCMKTAWYRDADGDGFGTPDEKVETCEKPAGGYVATAHDCDDGRGMRSAWHSALSGIGPSVHLQIEVEGATEDLAGVPSSA